MSSSRTSKTTRSKGAAQSARNTASTKTSSKTRAAGPAVDEYDADDNIEFEEEEYNPPGAIAEDDEIFGRMPGVEKEVQGHYTYDVKDDVLPPRSSSKKSSSGASHEGNRVLGGYKATLKNPRVSQEAKDHAQQVLDENA